VKAFSSQLVSVMSARFIMSAARAARERKQSDVDVIRKMP
jgi:hypothetical protein